MGAAAGLPKGQSGERGWAFFLGTGVRITAVGRAECSGTRAAWKDVAATVGTKSFLVGAAVEET